MRIALIFPPYYHKKFSENLSVVDDDFGKYPPLNLAYVAAILENSGHNVILIDANVLGLSKFETLKMIREFKPDFMGFMLTTYMFWDTCSWIQYLKRYIKIPVFVGGLNVWYYPKETLENDFIDYAIMGPASKSLPQLIDAVSNKKSLKRIKGICYKERKKVIINQLDDFDENIDDLPFPSRHLLPNSKYYSFISKRKNFTIMILSKGCPYKCSFCAIPNIPYHLRKLENVLKEIEECYFRFNIKEFDFFDACFTVNREYIIQFCKEILKRRMDFDWSCRTRVDLVDDELLRYMSKAGCKRIYYGIESANEQILLEMKKGTTIDTAKMAIRLTNKNGIKPLGFFMIGSPGESKVTMKATLKLAKKLNLHYVQFMHTIPKPQSQLSRDIIDAGGIDYWRDYVSGKIEERRIETNWCDLPDDLIDKEIKKMYIHFYLRPSYVFKTFFEIKSLHELIRYLRTGFRILFYKNKK